MVQLDILSGKTAGTSWLARRFPVQVGRAAGSDLQLEESGVWDQHFRVELVPLQGFVLRAQSQALVRLNGQSVQSSPIRNGDLIDLGSVRLRFWLAPARQRRLRWGEAVSCGTIVLMTLGQVALLYWLLK
ncbi:MAG TPA: FHA domain-containing protein [Verrucomicrobiae bacterium]|nr:FHA domain-containing protein [Verrucomicrobiae bacterium]